MALMIMISVPLQVSAFYCPLYTPLEETKSAAECTEAKANLRAMLLLCNENQCSESIRLRTEIEIKFAHMCSENHPIKHSLFCDSAYMISPCQKEKIKQLNAEFDFKAGVTKYAQKLCASTTLKQRIAKVLEILECHDHQN